MTKQKEYNQVKVLIDNVSLKQTDRDGHYYTEIKMIVFEKYNVGRERFEEIKPFRIDKFLYEAVYYRYRPQIFSQTKPYTMVPFDNYQTKSNGIWNNLETNPISQNKRIQGLNRLAALMFGWVDYSQKVDGFYKTVPFKASQIFYSFLSGMDSSYSKQFLARNFHLHSSGEDLIITPFEIFDGNYDFQLYLNEEIRKCYSTVT